MNPLASRPFVIRQNQRERENSTLDGGQSKLPPTLVHDSDADANSSVCQTDDFTAEGKEKKMRHLCAGRTNWRARWPTLASARPSSPRAERGIDLPDRRRASRPARDAEPFRLLCHLALTAPCPRRQRATPQRQDMTFFKLFQTECREIQDTTGKNMRCTGTPISVDRRVESSAHFTSATT
jgi:hypothetical protein